MDHRHHQLNEASHVLAWLTFGMTGRRFAESSFCFILRKRRNFGVFDRIKIKCRIVALGSRLLAQPFLQLGVDSTEIHHRRWDLCFQRNVGELYRKSLPTLTSASSQKGIKWKKLRLERIEKERSERTLPRAATCGWPASTETRNPKPETGFKRRNPKPETRNRLESDFRGRSPDRNSPKLWG